MKYSTYPLKINGTDIPFPDSAIKESYETLENVNETEAGTDVCQIRRMKKLTLSCSYQLMGSWATFFEGLAFSPSTFKVKLYDFTTSAYVEHTMRMREYSKSLVKGSEKINTGGMWQISFKLIEM